MLRRKKMKKIKIEIFIWIPKSSIVTRVAESLIDTTTAALNIIFGTGNWKPGNDIGEPVEITVLEENDEYKEN